MSHFPHLISNQSKIKGTLTDYTLTDIQIQIIRTLYEHGSLNRNIICQYINKKRTVTFKSLTILIHSHIVYRFNEPLNQKGRPHVKFGLCPNWETYIII